MTAIRISKRRQSSDLAEIFCVICGVSIRHPLSLRGDYMYVGFVEVLGRDRLIHRNQRPPVAGSPGICVPVPGCACVASVWGTAATAGRGGGSQWPSRRA